MPLFSSVPYTDFLNTAPPATSTQLIYNSKLLVDGAILYGNQPDGLLTGSSATPQLWFGPKTALSFTSSIEYQLSYNVAAIKTSAFEGRMDVYLVGTGFSNHTSSLGYLIATHTIPSTTNVIFLERQQFLINPSATGTARLRFVLYGAQWSVSDIVLEEATEFGFNPQQTRIIVPITNRRHEHLVFKAQLFDINNNVVPLIIESDPIVFDGGTFQIRGTNNRIDGTLIVSPSGSGPVLGTNTSGSFIGISPNTNLPQPIDPTTLTTTTYTGSAIITIYSGNRPFQSSSLGPASGIQVAGGPSGSFLDFNGLTGRLTIRGDILLLPGTALSQSIVSASMFTGSTDGTTALTQIQALVSGNLNGGTYLNGNSIISPVIAGNTGYFSTQFGVGNIAGGRGIVLTSLGYTASTGTAVSGAPAIYIGAGRHFNSNTPFLVASSSTGPVFSLGDKVSFQPSASTYEAIISGTIAVESAGKGNGFFNVLNVISQTATQSIVTSNANLAFSSSIFSASIASVSASNAQTSASLINVSQSLAAQAVSYSASLSSAIATVSASNASNSASAAQAITSQSILDSVNKVIRLPTITKTTAGLYIESSSIGFWQPHPSGSGISSSNFPVIINDNGQFRFARSSSWSGSSTNGAFTEQIAFANGAFVVQARNMLLDSYGVQLISSDGTASVSNVLKIGPGAATMSVLAGTGFYADGAGNFRVGETGTGNDHITLVPNAGLFISASKFFLDVGDDKLTTGIPEKLKINKSEIALGKPLPTSYAPSNQTGSTLITSNPGAEQNVSVGWVSSSTWYTASDASPPGGSKVFEIYNAVPVFKDEYITVDATHEYIYKFWARTNSGSSPNGSLTYMALECYDDKFRPIDSYTYYAPGILTASLTAPLVSSSVSISIDNATGWVADDISYIAFDVQPDGSDIPNFRMGHIKSGSKVGNTFVLSSWTPSPRAGGVAGASYPSGTLVRYHRATGTYIYPWYGQVSSSWVQLSGSIRGSIVFGTDQGPYITSAGWRPGTKYTRIGLLPQNDAPFNGTTSSRFDNFEFYEASRGASGFYTNTAGQLFVGSGSVGSHAGEGSGSWISFGGTDLNIRTEKLFLNTPGLSILGSNNVAASNAIKLGTNASGITLNSGSGAYIDGTGNFRIGTGVTDATASYIQFTPSNALIISASNFFLNSNSGSTSILLSPLEISLGQPRPRTFEPTAATSSTGVYFNYAGQFFMGSGSAFAGQEAGDWISFGGQLLNIHATAVRLWASGSFKVDSTRNSGYVALGAATAYGTGVGAWIDGTNQFRVGDPAGKRIQFDGTNFLLNTTTMKINSSTPHIAMDAATSFTVGNGIWIEGNSQFRVGPPIGTAGNKINYDGTNFIVSSSTFALNTTGLKISSQGETFMLGSAVTSFTVGTGVYMDGTGQLRAGNPVGPRISFDGSTMIVSASTFGLQTSTMIISSVLPKIALGASANSIVYGGTGIYMDGTGQFSVGNSNGTFKFNGTQLTISGSKTGLAISGSAQLQSLVVIPQDTTDYVSFGILTPYDANNIYSAQPFAPAGLSVNNTIMIADNGVIRPNTVSGSLGVTAHGGIIPNNECRWTYGAFIEGINVKTFSGHNNVAPTSSYSTSAPSGTPPVGTIHVRY